jgi:CubicO group peptidase (beta-lactamase class C family)
LLPDLAAHQVLTGYNDAGEPQWRPPASAISLRQLLSHSSGLGYHIWNASLGRFAADQALEGSDILLGLPLANDPGSIWEYSVSTDWVGEAVGASSGLSLEEYFQAEILGPLGMVDTTFESARLEERHVPLNHREAESGWSTSPPEIPDRGAFYSGGGGLVSTAPDYLRFVQALLRGGELDGTQILSPEMVALMGENQIGELVVREMPESLPLSNAFLIGPPGEGKFGLGFQINTVPLATGRSAGSLAWAGLFNTYYWIDPTAELASVICMQMLPFFDGPCIDLFERFERAVYDSA